jgi:carbon monoxide dehydrogenase subunit G
LAPPPRPAASIEAVRIRKEIEVHRPVGEAFAYVADFSNAAEWDPGVVEARKLTDGPVRVGSEFDVVALFRGKRQRFRYVVTELQPERRIVLAGDGEKAMSVDEVAFEPAGDATRITYVADIRLKGILRPAGLLLAPVMSKMGTDALAGLKSVLDGRR